MNLGQVQSRKKVRNPLSTLSDNVPLPQTTIRKRTESCIKKNYTKKTVVRSKSTSSGIEARFKFPQNVEKITVRSTATSTSEDGDEVFVDAQEHLLLSYMPEKKPETTDLQNLQKLTNSRIPMAKKPAQKVTLVEKHSKRSSKNHTTTFQVQQLFANGLYDVEYFADNYAHMIRTEGKYVIRKSYLTKYIDFKYRILIVNWMIHVQQNLSLSEISLFVTIRMMDNLLVKTKISESKYALIGLTCMWIASKMFDCFTILATKLFAVCNGKFSRSVLLAMEKEILKSFNFNINFPEPLSFLYYYLKNENLEKDSKVLFGAMFLLEMFTFLLEFSSTSPSVLAATAVYLVLMRYDINCDAFLRYIESNLLEESAFKRFSEHMWKCIKEILATKCLMKNEVVGKYSVESKFNVVQYFTSD